MPFDITLMELEVIIFSELSQAKKKANIICSHLYVGVKIFDHMEVESGNIDNRDWEEWVGGRGSIKRSELKGINIQLDGIDPMFDGRVDYS